MHLREYAGRYNQGSGSADMSTNKKRPALLEFLAGLATEKIIKEGREDPVHYEKFSVFEYEFPASEKIMWLCFLGIATARPAVARRLTFGKIGMIPRQGQVFVFHGPAGIAGYTPDQCSRSTLNVMKEVRTIVSRNPGRKIKILCFSAGTHLGFYVANELGRESARPIDQLIAIAPGQSIAFGIYSTWVTTSLVRELKKHGITKEIYDQAIFSLTQRANIRHLPSGKNLIVHAGTADTFIPMDMPGGTNDLIKQLRASGKEPTYIVHDGKDHATLLLKFLTAVWRGIDPYTAGFGADEEKFQ